MEVFVQYANHDVSVYVCHELELNDARRTSEVQATDLVLEAADIFAQLDLDDNDHDMWSGIGIWLFPTIFAVARCPDQIGQNPVGSLVPAPYASKRLSRTGFSLRNHESCPNPVT